MLTREFMFGMNFLSFAGFALMGVALAMQRQKRLGTSAVFGLMSIGTLLLIAGFYLYAP